MANNAIPQGFHSMLKPIKQKYPIGMLVKWAGEFSTGFEVGRGKITGYNLTSFQEGSFLLYAIIDEGRKEFIIYDPENANYSVAISKI